MNALEQSTLALLDPSQKDRRECARIISEIPAQLRRVAGLRNACINAMSKGVQVGKIKEAWRKIDQGYTNFLQINTYAKNAWNLARERGEVTGSMPLAAIVLPLRPDGLEGPSTTTVQALGMAVGGAIALGALFVIAVALLPGIVAAIGATASVLIALSAAAIGFLGVATALISGWGVGGGGATFTGFAGIVVVGLGLWLFASRRKA